MSRDYTDAFITHADDLEIDAMHLGYDLPESPVNRMLAMLAAYFENMSDKYGSMDHSWDVARQCVNVARLIDVGDDDELSAAAYRLSIDLENY